MAYAIGSMSGDIIKFPENMIITRMPGVIGCIDCTHIAIQMPIHFRPEIFRNRKVFFFSLNVQAMCGRKLEFFNVVARWPGSAHDSNIFFYNSRLCQELEDDLLPGHLLSDSGYL